MHIDHWIMISNYYTCYAVYAYILLKIFEKLLKKFVTNILQCYHIKVTNTLLKSHMPFTNPLKSYWFFLPFGVTTNFTYITTISPIFLYLLIWYHPKTELSLLQMRVGMILVKRLWMMFQKLSRPLELI